MLPWMRRICGAIGESKLCKNIFLIKAHLTKEEASMRKTIALVTCFALLSICVPLTYAGPQNPYFRSISVPGELLSSIFFFLSPVNTVGLRAVIEKSQSKNSKNFRVTGDIPIRRIGEGD